jgi:hypothetical protein
LEHQEVWSRITMKFLCMHKEIMVKLQQPKQPNQAPGT